MLRPYNLPLDRWLKEILEEASGLGGDPGWSMEYLLSNTSERNALLKSLRTLFSRRYSMRSEFVRSDSGPSHKEFTNDLRKWGLGMGSESEIGSDSIHAIGK